MLPVKLQSKHCIHQIFEAQVEQTPDAIAVVFQEQQLTYRQLNERANQLAGYLRSLGVGKEVLVGICVESSLEMVVGVLGILKAGGAYVPLDPAYPLERLAFILEDTQTPVILTQEKLSQNLPVDKTKVVCLDSEWEIIAQYNKNNLVCSATINNLMYVIYTSGSTGKPKGVMISHLGICNQLHWRQTTFGLTQTDKVLQTISFSFDPSVWQLFWPLCFGAQLVIPRPGGHQDAAYLIELISKLQITVTAFVPSMLRVILSEKGIESCKCLRHISCGGEALPTELIETFYNRLKLDNVLHNVYGPTEASIDATFWTCQRKTNHSIAPIGYPIANTQIYILDSDLQEVPKGEPGELHISGIGVARGYFNRPDLTTEKFIVNPFCKETEARLYKTGDLARYLPDGNIEFLGRIDQQVKIRGFRIELGEIEARLLQHHAVREAVVISREDIPGEKRLVAYIVLQAQQELAISELRSFLEQTVANYMIPAAFVTLSSLPLTPNGKVDRRALPAPQTVRPQVEKAFIAPRNTVEVQLTQIWEELLGVHPIGIQDNFFELGGSSLQAGGLLRQIEERFGKTMPLSIFLRAATVEELANFIRQKESSEIWSLLIPIQTNGNKPPLFCIHGSYGDAFVFRKFANLLEPDQPVYALQPQGLDGKQPLPTQIEDMAAKYIQQIRTVQPEGPYFLVGYSSGGVIAFEMGQQILAQGQKVGMLAMLDTISPIYNIYNYPLSFRQKISFHFGNLLRLKPLQWFTYLSAAGKQRLKPITNEFDVAPIQLLPTLQKEKDTFLTMFNAHKEAMKEYSKKADKKVYEGKIILYRCEDQSWWIDNEQKLGWDKLATLGVEVHDILGKHESVLTSKDVHFFAEKFQKNLSAAQSKINSIENSFSR